jgi:hypothetical protein
MSNKQKTDVEYFPYNAPTQRNTKVEWKEEDWIKFVSEPSIFSRLESVPEEFKTYKVCYTAVKENGRCLADVPEKWRQCKDLCKKAIGERYGHMLKYVPINLRDSEICRMAVKNDPNILTAIPYETRDYDICLISVKVNGGMIQHVPDIHKTRELCVVAISTMLDCEIEDIPAEIKTEDFFVEVVKICHNVFSILVKISKQNITEKIVTEAGKKNIKELEYAFRLGYVPKQEISTETWDDLIKYNCQQIQNNVDELSYVPVSMILDVMRKMYYKLPDNFEFNLLKGCVFTGEQFNKLIGDRKLYKFTNKNEDHNGFIYKSGLNQLDNMKEKFNPTGTCSKGGLYFTEASKSRLWTLGKFFQRTVTIPNDALVYVESNKFKTDMFILGERSNIV